MGESNNNDGNAGPVHRSWKTATSDHSAGYIECHTMPSLLPEIPASK